MPRDYGVVCSAQGRSTRARTRRRTSVRSRARIRTDCSTRSRTCAVCSVRECYAAFSYQGEQYKTHLLGSYQPYNAVLAIEAARVLRSRGFTIPQTALHEGIASTRWLGRFDVRSTCNDWRCVVCDGGHNPQGARALAQSLDRAFPHTKCVFVMSVLADKNYEAMIDALLDYACLWVCVTPPSPRALSAHDACACVSRKAHERNATFSVCEARSYDDAITLIQNSTASQGVPVIFFGSLYALKDTYNSLYSSGVLPSTPWGVSKK